MNSWPSLTALGPAKFAATKQNCRMKVCVTHVAEPHVEQRTARVFGSFWMQNSRNMTDEHMKILLNSVEIRKERRCIIHDRVVRAD